MALIAMVLILFVAAAHSAAVPDEKGCPDNPPKETCSARQDVVLVVDNSYSVAGRHNDISEWMRQFVGLYDLTKDDPRSPQIGVVTFNGCVGCSSSQSVEVIYPVSNDEAALLDAINTRKDPDPEMPMTCISCAISVAVQMLSAFGQAENMPLVMLLTDGEQTVLGGDEAAVYAAEQAKAQGVNVVSLSLGRADQDTMDRIASLPTETYSRNADTVEQLLDEAPLPLSPSATSATANARFPAPPLAGDRSRQYLLHPSRARMPPPERLPGAGARALRVPAHARARRHRARTSPIWQLSRANTCFFFTAPALITTRTCIVTCARISLHAPPMHTQVRLSIHGSGFLLREEVEGGAPQALSCRITGVGNPPLTPVVVGAAQYPEGDDSTLTYAPALPQSPCRHCLGNQPPSAHLG